MARGDGRGGGNARKQEKKVCERKEVSVFVCCRARAPSLHFFF
jgi:hypothetical protein